MSDIHGTSEYTVKADVYFLGIGLVKDFEFEDFTDADTTPGKR